MAPAAIRRRPAEAGRAEIAAEVGRRPAKAAKGRLGALVEGSPQLTPAALRDSEVGRRLKEIWHEAGVLILRGLVTMTPEDLLAISAHFGEVEPELSGGRAHARVAGLPVMRLGNVRDTDGRLISIPGSSTARLPADGSCQYRPADRLPVWHTDGCHRARPPAGSAFFCRAAPPEGAETCFADAAAAYKQLSAQEQEKLRALECVCSLAHHDKKLQLRRPDYPTLTAEQRAKNPPRRVPVVLEHPATGRLALYGMNSSTCCLVPKGAKVSQEAMDRYDLEGLEDPSVSTLRDLLPRCTTPEFTLVWKWQEGDLVVWDNRSTMHTGTGFDEKAHTREMWRTSILP